MSLAHKGLDFEERPLAFTAIPGIENGFSKTVPVLRDGDRLVKDSFDIAVYLDEAYPDQPSLFNGEGGKALSRFVESWSQTQLTRPSFGSRFSIFMTCWMIRTKPISARAGPKRWVPRWKR